MSHLCGGDPMRAKQRALSLGAAILLSVALAAPAPAAWGATVDDEALAAGSTIEADRAKVRAFLERADLRERLQAMGVSGLNAASRVDALTDDEVHALAGRID